MVGVRCAQGVVLQERVERFARVVLLTVCMNTYGGVVVLCQVGACEAVVQVGANEHASAVRQ
eukprot:897074-Pyramimonas_sp.AAC.1